MSVMKLKMKIYQGHTLWFLMKSSRTFQNSIQISLHLSVTRFQHTLGKLSHSVLLYEVGDTTPQQQIGSDCISNIRQP